MKSLFEFENISFSYEGSCKPALQNFSMRIPAGKRCVVVGQNGSGKSTVLLLANGLLHPDEGRMLWKDEPLIFKKKYLKQHRQNTGLLFQNADEMLISPTVMEDLAYGLINAGYKGEVLQKKVEQMLSQYKLERIKDRPIHHLSLGEKRRVALAGVIGLEPELLLLDEPTAYLDPLQTNVFLEDLNNIHQAGATVVMSTHDLDLAYEWADWIFVMEKGHLVFEGTPDDLFTREKFVYEKGLTVPLSFQLKQIVIESNAYLTKSNKLATDKNELLQSLRDLLNKKEEK